MSIQFTRFLELKGGVEELIVGYVKEIEELRYAVLRCVVLCCVALRCVALRCVALRCVALCCVVLRCVALRCVVLCRAFWGLHCVSLFV